jgi:N-acetylmuramoyl-L-alanine amidase
MIINNWINDYPGDWAYRSLKDIKYLGVCHTASRLVGKSLRQMCDDINSWHKAKGWPCISYHYVISENGEIAQTNDHNANSYTVGDKRANTLCICLDGNFELDQPTQSQLNSLEALLNKLSLEHPEFPATTSDVLGDNELNLDTGEPTACPGMNLMPYIINYRNNGKMVGVVDTVEVINPDPIVKPCENCKKLKEDNIFISSEKTSALALVIKAQKQVEDITVQVEGLIAESKEKDLIIKNLEKEANIVSEKWDWNKFVIGLGKTGTFNFATVNTLIVSGLSYLSSTQPEFANSLTGIYTAVATIVIPNLAILGRVLLKATK